MSASELRERLAFSVRADTSGGSPPGDGYGNVEGDWEDQFEVAARIMPLKGGEDILAGRLSGTQPVIIKIRMSSNAGRIATGWKARNVRNDVEYNIRGVANSDEKREYLEILAVAGVAI